MFSSRKLTASDFEWRITVFFFLINFWRLFTADCSYFVCKSLINMHESLTQPRFCVVFFNISRQFRKNIERLSVCGFQLKVTLNCVWPFFPLSLSLLLSPFMTFFFFATTKEIENGERFMKLAKNHLRKHFLSLSLSSIESLLLSTQRESHFPPLTRFTCKFFPFVS